MAQYPCPQCSGKMFIEKMHEGYEVPCPHCGSKLRIPHGAAAEPQAAPAAMSSPPPLSETPADALPGGFSAEVADPARPTDDAAPAGAASDLVVEPEPDAGEIATVPPQTSAPAPRPPPLPEQRYVPPPRQVAKGQYDTLAFVLGLCGFLICPALSAFGWYFGHKARAEARAAGREPDGLATAGWVLGIVGTVLLVGGMALAIVVVLAGVASGM